MDEHWHRTPQSWARLGITWFSTYQIAQNVNVSSKQWKCQIYPWKMTRNQKKKSSIFGVWKIPFNLQAMLEVDPWQGIHILHACNKNLKFKHRKFLKIWPLKPTKMHPGSLLPTSSHNPRPLWDAHLQDCKKYKGTNAGCTHNHHPTMPIMTQSAPPSISKRASWILLIHQHTKTRP